MKIVAISSSVKIISSFYLILFISTSAYSQLIEFPISSLGSTKIKPSSFSRTQSTNTLNLPFWDDFSYSDTLTYPKESLWQYGKSVFMNNGLGIKQPTKNIVTFDGVDSLGKPYNVNDVLAKGLADKLVSQPIQMNLVDPALRGTVYLSFFYQVKGRGENPDLGDQLILSCKNSDNKWESIYVIENNDALQPDVFYQAVIPVTSDRFFHKAFQFRLQNFARLSGPYDTWNVDYIYLNTGRSVSDTPYPDRSVSSALNSLFVDYYAMPVRHFLKNTSGNLKKPSLDLYNLKSGNLQPFDYSTEAKITTKIGNKVTSKKIILDVAQDPGTILVGLQFLKLTLNKIPPESAFDPSADSIGIKLKYGMSTKDNIPPEQNGDYNAAKYSPIDFRTNDTIQANYTLASYYAYDDGSAEYGAGLNQSGSYLAFKFNLKSSQSETLTYVDIYFPEFGDNTNQSLKLQIRSDLTDPTSTILYEQNINVKRTTQSKFVRYTLSPSVVVTGAFYIGWKQLSSASIPVGLDKNTDNGDKIYYNTNGTWIQNVTVKGSMMVRAGFGKEAAPDPITGVETKSTHSPIYPNPSSGTCFLPAEAENVFALDFTGRKLETDVQQLNDKKSLRFLSPVSGLVIVRYSLNGKPQVEKIMVLAELR